MLSNFERFFEQRNSTENDLEFTFDRQQNFYQIAMLIHVFEGERE